MKIDIYECVYQLRALFRLCFLRPNSWRELVVASIALVFAPLVVFVCVLANTRFYPGKDIDKQ